MQTAFSKKKDNLIRTRTICFDVFVNEVYEVIHWTIKLNSESFPKNIETKSFDMKILKTSKKYERIPTFIPLGSYQIFYKNFKVFVSEFIVWILWCY